jgi:hypothetical protein
MNAPLVPSSWNLGRRIGAMAALVGLLASGVLAVLNEARAQEPKPALVGKAAGQPFVVPRLETLKRVERPGGLSPLEASTSCYILRTEPHAVQGNAYVVVTDHRDEAYLEPLRRLAAHHQGIVLPVDDLGALADRTGRAELARRFSETRPRYVAVAPRLESFRENMLLGLWNVLATLDSDPELDVLPGLLVAPDAVSFAALVDHSLTYQPPSRKAFRAFIVSQLVNGSPMGSRSLQKLGILREFFGEMGCEVSGLVVRQFPGERPRLEGRGIVDARPDGNGPRSLLARLPASAAEAIGASSLIVMFGHGTPGMTCGMRVEAFDEVSLLNKVILCGSCMSAAPTHSDFRKMAVGPDGSEVVADRKRFLMEAIERGAVVAYGHMRLNAGFPHLYPVLEAVIDGETVGESYQRLIDGLLRWTRLDPDELVLAKPDTNDEWAIMRRNQLLYVLIGDPALRPLAPLPHPPTSRPADPAGSRAPD